LKEVDVPNNPFVKGVGSRVSRRVYWGGGNMLEIRKTALSIEENELIELQRIIIDGDKEEALRFLKKSVFDKIMHSQQGKLKSHLDGDSNPAEKFKNNSADI
jgi:hypothetical protein